MKYSRKIVIHEKSVKWSKHALQTVELHYTDIGYVGNVDDTQSRQEITANAPETERPDADDVAPGPAVRNPQLLPSAQYF